MQTHSLRALCALLMTVAISAFAAGPAANPPPATAPGSAQPKAVASTQAPVPSVNLQVDTAIGAYGAVATLRATLTSANGPLSGKDIMFSVDDKPLTTYPRGTNSDGKADLPFTVTSDLALGEHVIKAKLVGDAGLPAMTATGKLTVIKAATKMGPLNAGFYYIGGPNSETITKIFVKGSVSRTTDQRGLDGRAIDILVDGKKIDTVGTDAKGNFSYEQNWNKRSGTYTMRAEFSGDSHYTGAASPDVSEAFNAPAPNYGNAYRSKPVVMPLALVVGGKATMSVKVTSDKDGKVGIPKVSVLLNYPVDGPEDGNAHSNSVPAVTNADGIASAVVPINAAGLGWFWATIKDPSWKDGNANDPPGMSPTTRMEVAKAPLNVSAKGPKTAKIGETIPITIDANNAAFGSPAENVSVSCAETGDTAMTDKNGKATLNFNVPPGMPFGATQIRLTVGSRNYVQKTISHPISIAPKDN